MHPSIKPSGKLRQNIRALQIPQMAASILTLTPSRLLGVKVRMLAAICGICNALMFCRNLPEGLIDGCMRDVAWRIRFRTRDLIEIFLPSRMNRVSIVKICLVKALDEGRIPAEKVGMSCISHN